MKITAKFILVMFGVTVIVFAGFTYFRVQRDMAVWRANMEHDIRLLGQTLEVTLGETWRANGQQGVLHVLAAMEAKANQMHFSWFTLGSATGADPHQMLMTPAQLAALQQGRRLLLTTRDAQGTASLVFYTPVIVDHAMVGVLVIDRSLAPIYTHVYHTILHTVVGWVGLVGLGGGVMLYIGRRVISWPVRQVIEKTAASGLVTWRAPFEARSRDEFAEVAMALNQMSERLKTIQEAVQTEIQSRLQALQQLRHADRLKTIGTLTSGIAHELGTPLNVISGRASLIASGRPTPAGVAESVGIIKDQVQLSSKMAPPLTSAWMPNRFGKCRSIWSPTPGRPCRRADRSMFTWLVAALILNAYRPSIVTEQPTAALIRASGQCATCHANQQYSVIHEYELSVHARKKINCLECHQPATGQQGQVHHGFVITTHVTAANCRTCHERIYQQFLRSRHATPAWAAVYGDKDLTAEQVAFSEQFHPGACKRAANPLVALEGAAAIGGGCAECHSIGRPNPDGTIGSCTACHTRHTASVEIARLPSTCGQCHLGPDHSQMEIYEESKHGILFAVQRELLNLSAPPDQVTTRDMFIPTCATCHMSGLNGLQVTHDTSQRLSYKLFAEVSDKRPDYARAQANMQDICLNCHTSELVDRVYQEAAKVVAATNDKILDAKKIVDGLRADGVLPAQPFQEPIDFEFFDLWHYYGRTSKHGAFMDRTYLHWCMAMMLLQVGIGLLGFFYHNTTNLHGPSSSLFQNLVYGAPPLAPLLFPNLAMLSLLGLFVLRGCVDRDTLKVSTVAGR